MDVGLAEADQGEFVELTAEDVIAERRAALAIIEPPQPRIEPFAPGVELKLIPFSALRGRGFAREAARMVLGLDPPALVRMLELPGLEEGQDIGDFGWDAKLPPQALGDRVRELARRQPAMTSADIHGLQKLVQLVCHAPE